MKCKKCNHNNAPLKRTCESCLSILEGECFNNVTGEFGYRSSDGSFTSYDRPIDVKKAELEGKVIATKVGAGRFLLDLEAGTITSST